MYSIALRMRVYEYMQCKFKCKTENKISHNLFANVLSVCNRRRHERTKPIN